MKKGFVALVGAGPGDAGLMTLRGKELLEKADVVVVDRLVSEDVLRIVSPHASILYVGKCCGAHTVPQEEINLILLREAENGHLVVRLKGGDPFVFGRGAEELELIRQHNIPFEVVPGITSALAVPAYAGIPATHRDFSSSVHIVTGHRKNNDTVEIDYEALVRTEGTLIFLMGVAALGEIIDGLLTAGLDRRTPVAIIENGTLPAQRKILTVLGNTCDDARAQEVRAPAVIIVGEVCTLSEEYDWFSKRPLFRKTIVVTRPVKDARGLSARLKALGADVLPFPCIDISTAEGDINLKKAIENINRYDWVVFTSRNGARAFFQALAQAEKDVRCLGHTRIAVIGPGTSETVRNFGIIADFIPSAYYGTCLMEELQATIGADERVLVITPERGSADVVEAIRAAGSNFESVVGYKTTFTSGQDHATRRIEQLLAANEKLYVTFTSASCVEGFMHAFHGADMNAVLGVCIGEQTAKKAQSYGIRHIVSDEATIDSMIKAILDEQEGS